MLNENRPTPLRIGPFLHRSPHQSDRGRIANDVERRDAEQVLLQPDKHEVGRNAQKNRIVGEMKDAIVPHPDPEQNRDPEPRDRHRATRQNPGGDHELQNSHER